MADNTDRHTERTATMPKKINDSFNKVLLLDTGILEVLDDDDAGLYRIRPKQGEPVLIEFETHRGKTIQIRVVAHSLFIEATPVNATEGTVLHGEGDIEGYQFFVQG
jgi:hypothetical protein